MKQADVWREQEGLKHVTKDQDLLLKRYKKLDNVISALASSIPSLQAQKGNHQLELERASVILRKEMEVWSFRACHML
jgi:hypothetical protein